MAPRSNVPIAERGRGALDRSSAPRTSRIGGVDDGRGPAAVFGAANVALSANAFDVSTRRNARGAWRGFPMAQFAAAAAVVGPRAPGTRRGDREASPIGFIL